MVKDKTILVTGGTGSIGRVLVRRVLERGAAKVIVLSRDEVKQFVLKNMIHDERLQAVICDVRDRDALLRVFDVYKNIDIIYHAAALKHVTMCEENPVEAALTNIVGSQNIVDVALKFGTPKVMLVSTDKAVEPANVMGASKFIAERIFLRAAEMAPTTAFSIVRFGNVANSRGSVIPTLVQSLLLRNELIITDPNVTRFIMKTSDAVNLVVDTTDIAIGGEIFILKMKAFKLKDLIEVIIHDIAPKLGISSSAVKMKVIGLVRGEKLHEKLVNDFERESLYDLGSMYVVVNEKLEKHKRYRRYKSADSTECISSKAELISREELKSLALASIDTLTHIGTI